MSTFLILLDYKNAFMISKENRRDYTSMNVDKIREKLEQYGHSVEIMTFSNIDFTRNYKGYFILYQTAEDIGVFYKDYIKDIVYYFERQGAFVLPEYNLLLAHHNKNYMELLRNGFSYEGFKTIRSKLYGTAEEAIKQTNNFPVIIKTAEGSGSRGVFLATNQKEFIKIVREISGVFIVNNLSSLKDFIIYRGAQRFLNKVQTKYRNYTFYRRKFIVQNYIEGLPGDYRVLYMGGRYYVLYRQNRENDFRASGSGNLLPIPDTEIPQGLFTFARKLTQEIEFPIISMDIGFDGQIFHLFEFQFLHIGPTALQASEFWYEYINGEWKKFSGCSDLENEYCRTINDHVQKLEKQKCL